MKLKLFNSLTNQVEEFTPVNKGRVGVYTCGPTVYDFVTIGNWRTYFLGDLLIRTLKYLNYDVNYVMNITDVGHLTGDNLGNADLGEDRMEKAARREGRTAWDIAKFYADDFLAGYGKLNLIWPDNKKFSKATDHIKEQIELIKKIEVNGFAYKTADGIYFDIKAYEAARNRYGVLSTLDEIKVGARVKVNIQKKDPRDFALWKFSPKDEKRQMEWSSPWGTGFPGWHIECSAMSMKYLGEQFDIHLGGEDLRSTHHPNEIAQSEAATGKKPFVKYWLHGAFLLVDGKRMGKSLGNAYTLTDIIKKGYSPLDLRYFYLNGYYRKQLNFTWASLDAARNSYKKLKILVKEWSQKKELKNTAANKKFSDQFKKALFNDLFMPEVMAAVWEMAHSNLAAGEKYKLIKDWDRILGLDLTKASKTAVIIPEDILKLAKQREAYRRENKWEKADGIRKIIEKKGYSIEDSKSGPVVKVT